MNSRKAIMTIFTFQALETIEKKEVNRTIRKIYWSYNIYLALHFWKKINFPSAPWQFDMKFLLHGNPIF